MEKTLLNYLKTHGKTPESYILSKFKAHDIVLLGEMHYIKQELEILHRLIPLLPAAGIHYIVYEFARREDQPLVDRLLTNPHFDVNLAKRIMIQQESIWGYHEYLEVFRIIWQLNQALPTAKQIRLIGLNDPYNWKLYREICETQKREPNPQERSKIWAGCSEEYWADTVGDIYRPGTKILGYMGSLHGITKYREANLKEENAHLVFQGFETKRFGNYLYERYGDQVFNICFYDFWDSVEIPTKMQAPAGGIIEKAISPHYQEIAFDLINSPFGDLPDDSSFSLGYPDFRLQDHYDGMIYVGKLADFKPLSPISDFIDADNIEIFRDFNAYNADADLSIEQINEMIRKYADLNEE